MLALAADHVILDPELFHAACIAARKAADAGHIAAFGIAPSEPRTGYGYIRCGASLGDGIRRVERFVEKPDAAKALRYLDEGYVWNSGNFMFRADVLVSELERHAPPIAAAVAASVESAREDLGFLRLDAESYARAPQLSFDYAVMEKTDRAVVVEGKFRWSDIGSWDAIFEISKRDADNNFAVGPVVAVDSENCLIHAEERLTAVLGIRDLIVVTTPDAVLVVPRERAEEVKGLVALLKQAGRPEATNHRRCHRPWGYYDAVDVGERFQVKRLVVTPGGTLSLQRHLHRSEHWVVVRGTAEVTIGEVKKIVHENESAYIPMGAVHRLSNPGKIALELIEVQTGSYFGEDDIIRLDDVYRRGPAE